MLIRKEQKVEIKGIHATKWKAFIAHKDFDTGDTRWSLWDDEEKRLFEPLGERCKIRIVDSDGKIVGGLNNGSFS